MLDHSHLRLPIAVVLLTYNEEMNIERCMQSVFDWGKDIFVVDSGSTDRTLDIVKRHGAQVLYHPFETHAKQWAWALENLSFRCEWVLCLDADQRITSELKNELMELFSRDSKTLEGIDGFYIKRRQIFRGKWIRHGGYYPKYLLKLFKRKRVSLDEGDLVDHHFYVKGVLSKLKYDLIEENMNENDISFWIKKHLRYATLLAEEELRDERKLYHKMLKPSLFRTPDQRVLWLKKIWRNFPLYYRSWFYFIYRYFLRLGFLDGKEGFIFHFMQALWFRLLVDIELNEKLKRKLS